MYIYIYICINEWICLYLIYVIPITTGYTAWGWSVASSQGHFIVGDITRSATLQLTVAGEFPVCVAERNPCRSTFFFEASCCKNHRFLGGTIKVHSIRWSLGMGPSLPTQQLAAPGCCYGGIGAEDTTFGGPSPGFPWGLGGF